jgi:uncharacterized membrane protein YdjX (TVP38/TMEM64 family)
MTQSYTKNLVIITSLVIAGILLEVSDILDTRKILNIAREFTDHWWLILVLILLQILLFTFALPGSFFLWIVAPLYPPAISALILATGGTLGGITAYLFSKYLTDEWRNKIKASQTYTLLHKQDNFLTLFALRVFPAFPHSLINYCSGILNIKPGNFIPAAIFGISIKSYLYSKVIYQATTSESLEELLNISTYGPLIILSAISLVGVYIKYKLAIKNHPQQ